MAYMEVCPDFYSNTIFYFQLVKTQEKYHNRSNSM